MGIARLLLIQQLDNSHSRAKTSALLVGTPFGYVSPCAWFEPWITRHPRP
jgi:hypothetical protein